MAGDWIKLEAVTPDKPEVSLIAESLDIDEDAVTGKLVRLWIWADQQSVDGNALSVTDSFLDRITFCRGFANALRKVGWIVGESGAITLPNFDRHNGKSAKKRAQTNRRVAANRSKSKDSESAPSDAEPSGSQSVTLDNSIRNAASVTSDEQKALPEKRREEVIIHTHNNERKAPELDECEKQAVAYAPAEYAELAASIGRGFHGIYAAQEWRTQGGQDLLVKDAWKHKLRNHLESELRKEISSQQRYAANANARQNNGNAARGGRKHSNDAGEGISVPIL